MASSKPGLRTFARKRKETAEDKFDAIFGPKNAANVPAPKDGTSTKRRRQVVPEIRLPRGSNPTGASAENHRDTAAEKFDALFGSPMPANGDNCRPKVSAASVGERGVKLDKIDWDTAQISSNVTSPSKNNSGQSKYERMFEESEKSASDKFDAIFSESEHISKGRKPFSSQKLESRSRQSQVLNDLHKFNSWVESPEPDSPANSSKNSSPTKPTSPTKLPSITHASMQKVGGRLVLNIQRGGNANSLIEKGGTVLVSPEAHSNSVTETTSDPKFPSVDSKTEENGTSDPTKTFPRDEVTRTEKKSRFLPSPMKVSTKAQQHPNQSKNLPEKEGEKSSYMQARRFLVGTGKKNTKSNVSYNPRPWAVRKSDSEPNDGDDDVSEETFSLSQPTQSSTTSSKSQSAPKSKTDDDVPSLRRTVTWPKRVGESAVTSVKCRKSQETYFTVVHHVKNYQNCLEEGEIKEFEDEIIYLQGGLASDQPVSVRCLSATSLACKCQQQNFRLYLRAHNVLADVFSSLQDADQDKALSLAAASLLYMLSRDRQIDISKSMLRILLKLVDPLDKSATKDEAKNSEKPAEPKASYSKLHRGLKHKKTNPEQEYDSVSSKVKDLIDQCGDPLVTSADLSTKMLASEALLRFTARRTSEWYREEIRLKGGLDHIIALVKTQVEFVEGHNEELVFTQPLAVERPLCVLERLLRVLENGIVNSPRNAMYLVTHQRALLLKKLSVLISRCKLWLHQTAEETTQDNPPSPAKTAASLLMKNVISQVVKLLVNISNDSEWSSTRIGDQDGMLHAILCCILLIPNRVNEDHRYEIILLSLGLLVNLVESSPKNRMTLMKMKLSPVDDSGETEEEEILAVDALVKLFIDREVQARENEILGEDGVKKAVEAKKHQMGGAGDASANSRPAGHSIALGDADSEGYWVENEEGMEWVSVERKEGAAANDELPSSQGSYSSVSDPRNIEARLTNEQKNEMKDALEKANDHMEASIVASYAAIVLGCLIHGSRANSIAIRSQLPNDGELSPMIRMLKKFHCFMKLTHGMSKKGETKLVQIIEDMEEVNSGKTV